MSPTLTIVTKMSSYEHKTSYLKKFAKLKGTNISLIEDVRPANQSIHNAKMGELQAARQRGLIAYFSGTALVTRMKSSTHSSHVNAASLGTADVTAISRDKAEQNEAELTGSSEICEETGSRRWEV